MGIFKKIVISAFGFGRKKKMAVSASFGFGRNEKMPFGRALITIEKIVS